MTTPVALSLAQLNVARLTHPPADPRVAPFMNALDAVNAIAERSDGFVWRLVGDVGNATDVRTPDPRFDDPCFIVNLSVWRDGEALERFVWTTVHRRFYERRREWFEALQSSHLVFWHVAADERPSVDDALARLDHLQAHGPSERAFGWADLAGAQQWRTARCAPAPAA